MNGCGVLMGGREDGRREVVFGVSQFSKLLVIMDDFYFEATSCVCEHLGYNF